MRTITVHQLKQAPGVPLIDVREAHEFEAGHVPGAQNFPMSSIGDRLQDLPEGALNVICEVGGRSGRVVEALEARGYEVTNVDGGTREWVAAGYAVQR